MKRILCFVLLFLLLTACAGQTSDSFMEKAMELRTGLMASGGCTFQAKVSADFGERIYDFTIDCDYTPDSEASLAVLSPEMIAGIRAKVSADGAIVTFDGAELDFGQLANGRIAPMAIPWLLGKAWSSEYISSAGKDEDTILVTYLMGYGEEEVVLETWLDETGVPVHCDVSYDGQRCLAVTISDFRYK